jgi:hypothetical protein
MAVMKAAAKAVAVSRTEVRANIFNLPFCRAARCEPHTAINAGSVPNENYRYFSVVVSEMAATVSAIRTDSWAKFPTEISLM